MDEIFDHHKFPPVGHCIYCGTSEGDLTDEHIIPYSLHGDMILPKSTCETCREVTRKNEELCTHERWGMFAPLRARIKAPSRRRWTRNNEIRVKVTHADGTDEIKAFPANTFPAIAYGVRFPPAGILADIEPATYVRAELILRFPNSFKTPPKGTTLTIGTFRWGVFYKLLAKIAYSFAATRMAREELLPMLADIIFGRTDKCSYLIGGSGPLESCSPILEMHKVTLKDLVTETTRFSLVDIQLYGPLGLPTYHVVVGKRLVN